MEKRVFLGLALMFLLLGFYPVILQKFYPEYGKNEVLKTPAQPRDAKAVQKPEPVFPVAGDYSLADDVFFKNDKLRLVFNPKGGGIREIAFLDFKDDENKDPLKLLSAKNSFAAPLSVSLISPPSSGTESVSDISIDGKSVLVVSKILNDKIRMTRRFVFGGTGYSADLSVTFENISSAPADLQYQLYAGSRIPPRHSIDAQYIEADFFTSQGEKKVLKHVNETGLGKKVESEGVLNWAAIKDRHFSVIIKPKNEKTFRGLVTGLGNSHLAASIVSPSVSLPQGGSVTQEFLIYIGPNDLNELLPLGLEDIVNFGKMDLIGKVFIGGLEMLFNVFRNYGVAIIALTFLINLVLFPLTRQSFLSMKRMQQVQPQMAKLREKYKDNTQQLNKEMMELYKKHKVNPLGGCLPMLLQMPVFIALYVAISKFVKLIGADFLWVHDLSSPDRVPLPFTLPFLGNQLHVLPLIMIAGMAVQQRASAMSSVGQDPAMAEQQKMMAFMMPVIFGFIFYSMPAALVLYWLTNTVIMTSYQLYLKRTTVT